MAYIFLKEKIIFIIALIVITIFALLCINLMVFADGERRPRPTKTSSSIQRTPTPTIELTP